MEPKRYEKIQFPWARLIFTSIIAGILTWTATSDPSNFMGQYFIKEPEAGLLIGGFLAFIIAGIPMLIATEYKKVNRESIYWLAFFSPWFMIGLIFWGVALMWAIFGKSLNDKPKENKTETTIKLPQKAEHGDMWRLFLGGGKIPNFDTIVCFNSIHGKPTLFEYDGDLDKIKNLVKNPALLTWLCDIRNEWFIELKETKNAPNSTMTFFLFDKDGNLLGLAALWDNESFGRAFVPFKIPIGVIKNKSYDYNKLKRMSEINRKILFEQIFGEKH